MTNIGEESAIIREDESEQKGIAGLNELLEQEFKEDDSVEQYTIPLQCFIDEGDVRRYTSKFKLNHEDEASVVPDATLNSPEEGANIDNSSTSETELEIPNNIEKEVHGNINDAENLQSCEENVSATAFESTDMEITDQNTNEIKDVEEDGIIDENQLERVQNKEEIQLASEEIVCDVTLDNPEEGANTDNSSTLETELETPNASENEAPIETTDDAGNFQSCEEEYVPETALTSTDVDIVDQDMNKINDEEEADVVNESQNDHVENKEDCPDTKEVGSGLTDHINQEHNVVEQIKMDFSEEETNEEKEAAEEVVDSVESASQPEMPCDVPAESEEAADSQGAQDESAMEVSEGINDELSTEDEKTECPENTADTDTVDTNSSVFDKPVLSPVFKISTSSEAKKPIITAKLMKSNSELSSKPADNCPASDKTKREQIILSLKSFRVNKGSVTILADSCGVGNPTNTEDTVRNTKPTESEERKLGYDEPKTEESTNEVQSDNAENSVTLTPKIIVAKKVYGNTKKKSPSVQKKSVPSPESSSSDTQTHHHSTNEDVNMENGVEADTHISIGKEKIKAKPPLEKSSEDSCMEKREIDFTSVKRKIEEISRIRKQDEKATLSEIKKIKKETIDILEKIDEEMKQLQKIYSDEP